jgi:hypothetical protein
MNGLDLNIPSLKQYHAKSSFGLLMPESSPILASDPHCTKLTGFDCSSIIFLFYGFFNGSECFEHLQGLYLSSFFPHNRAIIIVYF